jgi:hypothetical protein
MVFVQMEALTGLRSLTVTFSSCTVVYFILPSNDLLLSSLVHEAAKDEWDFWGLGMSNHPFIKANYPHHEGIWGREDAADQVIMVVRNIRKLMVECECES